MSRIGRRPIELPAGVQVALSPGRVQRSNGEALEARVQVLEQQLLPSNGTRGGRRPRARRQAPVIK